MSDAGRGSGQSGFDQGRLEHIKIWMQRYVDERKYPGSSLLIRRHGHEAVYHQCGQRNLATGQSWGRDTLVRLFSMTKPVTSVAALMLMERGLLSLDAPLSAFIPEFSDMRALVPGAERIDQTEAAPSPTLHQLMVHTSGLSYSFNPGPLGAEMAHRKLDFGPRQGQLADMARQVADLPLAFQPGQRWEYSVGIDILGRVIEVVSGKSLGQFFVDEIFDPLGMTETGFSVPQGTQDRFAALYSPHDGDTMTLEVGAGASDTLNLNDAPDSSRYLQATMHSGGGGLVGSIDDYMAFAEMLRRKGQGRDGYLVSPRTLDFAMRNHLRGDIASMGPSSFAEQPMDGIGFGLGGSVVLDPALARVPGSVGDFSWGGLASTFFWVDPVLDLSVVFLTQLAPSSAYPSRAELKALVHGCLVG
ncbi:MAG: beta-lactamase family protein [Marinibacterium sp.]|nr:beta-lactamase family protein [Marinibacterium sp.]